MKPLHNPTLRRLLPLGLALALCGSASAVISVNFVVNDNGDGTFGYDFTVDNDTDRTFTAIDIFNAPGTAEESLISGSLMAPAGFDAFFDGGFDRSPDNGTDNGTLTFIEGNPPEGRPFGPRTVESPFTFTSTFSSDSHFQSFQAVDDGGGVVNGSTNLVPEPSSSALLGLSALGLLARRRRNA
jgi:hypothetical protein